MGFDCTLHVIDPASLASFVERFLERSKQKHPFDKSFKDGAKLFQEVREKLTSSPDEGARHLLQLCIMWCSAEAPHEYSRNFAISYWFRQGEAEDFPIKLHSFSLSSYLKEIEEAYPQIKGKLSLGFDGNYAVGYFIAPEGVPAARGFIEGQMSEVTAETRRTMEPMLKILRVAEKKKMAYWEATDLNVANGNAAWLKEKKVKAELTLKPIAEIPGLYHYANVIEARGDLFVVSTANPDNTYLVDITTPTAKVTHLAETFFSRAILRDEALYGVARHKHKNPYGLYQLPLKPAIGEPKLLHRDEEELSDLALTEDHKILLVPSKTGTKPSWFSDKERRELPVPESTEYYSKGFMLLPFGDGSHLLCWHKKFYLIEGDSLKELSAPEALHDVYVSIQIGHDEQWSDAPGRVLMHASGALLQITKDGIFKNPAPEIQNIRQLARGPERAIIIWQGDNESDDLFKILWPTMEVTSVKPKDLGVEDIQGLFWSEVHQCVVVRVGTKFIGVSWESLQKMTRRTLDEIGAKIAADQKKEAERKHKVWKANVEKKLSYTKPILLPVPADGIESASGKQLYVFSGSLIEHPIYGYGLVSRMVKIDEPVMVQFEHEERSIRMTDPIPSK